ncbi:MAG: cytochrome b6-f complex subunit PetL [Cyanobacteria bacterium J06635_13]
MGGVIAYLLIIGLYMGIASVLFFGLRKFDII